MTNMHMQTLMGHLQRGLVEVTFYTAAGKIRTYTGTRCRNHIPRTASKGVGRKERNASDAITFWVPEIAAWRSFNYSNVHNVRVIEKPVLTIGQRVHNLLTGLRRMSATA